VRVLETFLQAKSGEPAECEDAIVDTPNFIAVIDGATDKTGIRYDGKLGGRFAADVLSRRIQDLDPALGADDAIDAITDALAAALRATAPDSQDQPSASIAMVSRYHREVWRVGDIGIRLGDRTYRSEKAVDTAAAAARAALLAAELAAGKSADDLRARDPGREMILPLLQRQHALRNQHRLGPWYYGAIDGSPVPRRFIERFPIKDVSQVVLASDGYPEVLPTLSEAEELVARLIADDPLQMRLFPSTKGVRPGHQSFDDRAYVRVAL
jgi:hypothetical protein